MERADHAQAQRTFPVHDFGNLALALEVREQVRRLQAGLIQTKANGLDRIGRGDREVGFLVGSINRST